MKSAQRLLLFICLLFPLSYLSAKTLKIGVMPKLTGIDYFNAVENGALAAGKELGVEVVYDGPVTNDVTRQAAMVETWIAKRFDAICIAPNDPDAIAPVLRKARKRGITVITYDADSQKPSRDFFVNQATYEAIARALMDSVARGVGEDARYVILTGSLTAANQNIWMEHMEKYRQERYPKMKNLSPTPKVTEEDQALATQVTIDVLKSYPDLQSILAITSVALPGAAEGLAKAGAADRVYLTGLSTPKSMSDYVKRDILKEVILWNPDDLGYLAVYVAKEAVEGRLTEKSTSLNAGKLGKIQVEGDEVLLGDPLVFTKDNIGQYNF